MIASSKIPRECKFQFHYNGRRVFIDPNRFLCAYLHIKFSSLAQQQISGIVALDTNEQQDTKHHRAENEI